MRADDRGAGDAASGVRRSPLLDATRLRNELRAVTRQGWLLLGDALFELDRLDAAAGLPHEPAVVYEVQRKVAVYVRMFTRAHAAMIPPDDPRFAAAGQVTRYCDEADARAPWAHPVRLGAVA